MKYKFEWGYIDSCRNCPLFKDFNYETGECSLSFERTYPDGKPPIWCPLDGVETETKEEIKKLEEILNVN